jgi:hypothetical protein
MGEWDQNRFEREQLGGVDWIQLVQDKGRWRAVVNTVMNEHAGSGSTDLGS